MRVMRSNQSVVSGDEVVVFAVRVVELPGEEAGVAGESVPDLCASAEDDTSNAVGQAGRRYPILSHKRRKSRTPMAGERTSEPVGGFGRRALASPQRTRKDRVPSRKSGTAVAKKGASTPRKVTGKQLGEIAEALFLAKAAGLGFGVTKPWGDSEPYDFIVDGHGGHAGLSRVQVKSAHREGTERGYSFRAHGHSLKAYRERDVDALVAYVVPEDAWYVFPMRVFRKKRSVRLYPGSQRRRSKYEEYREGWWRLVPQAEPVGY